MAILKVEGKEIKAPFKTALHELYNYGDLVHVTTESEIIRGLLVKVRFSVGLITLQTVSAPRVIHLDNVQVIDIVNSCPADVNP